MKSSEPPTIEAPRTVHSGHPRNGGGWYFVTIEDDQGKWHWMLYAGNAKPIATSVIPCAREADCVIAIRTLTKNVHAAVIIAS